MDQLFEAIRRSCSAGIWSRGVELARTGAVSGEGEDGGAISLRVVTRGGLFSPAVTLHPAHEEWECDCASREDSCEHVAAGVIALRRAHKEGRALPQAAASGTLRYSFARSGGGLVLEREIVRGDQIHRLRTTLDAIAKGRVDGPSFVATPADLAVESVLVSQRRGPLEAHVLAPLVDALEGCDDIRLDGKPVRVSSVRILPHARVEEASGGFRVWIEPDATVSETFQGGIALCGDTLRLHGNSGLTGREIEDLTRGRLYSHDEAPLLVTEVLPSLAERIPLDTRTRQLPQTTDKLTPRIVIDANRRRNQLSLLPTLVYGDPPSARIDAGRLVHLKGAIPVRDREAEKLCVRHLRSALGLTPGHRIDLDAEEAIAFADRLADWHGEIRGDAHNQFQRAAQLEARLRIEDATFDLVFESPLEGGGGPRRASASAVLRAWQAGDSHVPLAGGGFAALPSDWLERFGHRVADLLAARTEDGALPASALPDLGRLCSDLDRPPPAALSRLAPLLDEFQAIPRAELPSDLHGELRDYQRLGVDWLCFLRSASLGALLADDMGLGKTLQALCALSGRTLVITPTSVVQNWAEEMSRFRPGLRFALYQGAGRELDPEADVTLTSYAILRLDRERLAAIEWECVILDEAQNIKNPESLVAQAAYSLRAQFRVALTGTPIENRLEELWSQLHFLNPGLLGGRRDFQKRYARPASAGEGEAAARLRERIRPFILRRLKREVARELPARTEVVLHCVLSDQEREVYDAVRAATVKRAVEKLSAGKAGVMEALEALLRLRQAACHSGLVPGQTAETSSKLELLIDRLEQAGADGHRALVFSQWTSLLDRVEPHLRGCNLAFERLDGSTRDRAGVVNRFQSESGPPVMLISLKAGGTGLNLTAADHIFLLDPWWNPAVEDQAADRAHRIGQQRPVVIHRLVAQDTVEERILELQQRKRSLADLALGEAESAGALTRDDLLALLSG